MRRPKAQGPIGSVVTILGLDIGFAITGYAVADAVADGRLKLRALGVIETKASDKKQRNVRSVDDVARRVREVGDALDLHVTTADLVTAEAFSYPPNASSAAKLAMVWGVVIEQARIRNLAMFRATPQEIKLAVAGRANASKNAVEAALVERFGDLLVGDLLDGVPDGKHNHAFDALGSIVACLDTDEVRLLLRR